MKTTEKASTEESQSTLNSNNDATNEAKSEQPSQVQKKQLSKNQKLQQTQLITNYNLAQKAILKKPIKTLV